MRSGTGPVVAASIPTLCNPAREPRGSDAVVRRGAFPAQAVGFTLVTTEGDYVNKMYFRDWSSAYGMVSIPSTVIFLPTMRENHKFIK